MNFQNDSYSAILKQPIHMRRSLNIPTYVSPQLSSSISHRSRLDSSWSSLLETLATLYESATTSTQFVDGRVKGTFASDHVLDLNQNTVSPLKFKSLTKKIKAVCETFFN